MKRTTAIVLLAICVPTAAAAVALAATDATLPSGMAAAAGAQDYLAEADALERDAQAARLFLAELYALTGESEGAAEYPVEDYEPALTAMGSLIVAEEDAAGALRKAAADGDIEPHEQERRSADWRAIHLATARMYETTCASEFMTDLLAERRSRDHLVDCADVDALVLEYRTKELP